jgi:hypothetical protein
MNAAKESAFEICVDLKRREGQISAIEANSRIDQALAVATLSGEYLEIACAIAHCPCLNDQAWAGRIFHQAISTAESGRDLIDVGYQIATCESLGNKDWARAVFEEALSKLDLDDFEETNRLAAMFLDPLVLGDKERGKTILENLLARDGIGSHETIAIAQTIVDDNLLGDKAWASALIDRAADSVEYSNDYIEIACCVAAESGLNRKEEGRRWFETAVREFSQNTPLDFLEIARCVSNPATLNDKVWAIDLCISSYSSIDEVARLLDIAAFTASLDRDVSVSIFKKALAKAITPNEFLSIACNVASQDVLGDKKWASEIFERACIGAGQEEIALIEANKKTFL